MCKNLNKLMYLKIVNYFLANYQFTMYVKTNRLSLNVSKTSYMIISNQKNALEIKFRETILTKVSTVKFLGVIIRSMKILLLRTM